MTKEEFKKCVSKAFVWCVTWEQFFEELWQLHVQAQWISVEDELPPCNKSLNDQHGNPVDYAIKVSNPVLVYANGEITIDRLTQEIEHGKPYGKPYWILHVTHWMPLPQPPKKGGEQ